MRYLLLLIAFASPAYAKGEADQWFGALTDRVIDDLAAGKPLVVQAHVHVIGHERPGVARDRERAAHRRVRALELRPAADDVAIAERGAFEGAVLAFATGGSYLAIRIGAAKGYATAGDHDLTKIGGVFTNPSDRRWGHWEP